ncbi:MAG: YkvA family protein [Caulobacteraceae bacterium]
MPSRTPRPAITPLTDSVFTRLRDWARSLKRDALAVGLAAADPRTTWAARLVAIAVAAYALSPIDLIPDFIPVLGYLDDVILIPAGLWWAIRLIPAEVLDEKRRAVEAGAASGLGRLGAVAVVVSWIGALGLAAWLGWRIWN